MLKEEGWLPVSAEICRGAVLGCRDPMGPGKRVMEYLYLLREQGTLGGRKQCEAYRGKVTGVPF